MSTAATPLATGVHPGERLEVLFEEIAELTGQRNAIDGRLAHIVAEIERDGLGVSPALGRFRRWWRGKPG
ncbi:hypothetical protein ABIA30_003866 [Mycobacterium sp. MAA66]